MESKKTGATIRDGGGVTFVVWAPHATAVSVVGDFNDWNKSAHPLQRDGDLWSGDVAEAAAGSEYKFILRTAEGELEKNDPVALEMTHSNGNSVVVDHSAFDWGDDSSFVLPPWNELVIYEAHLGTYFRGDNKETPGTFADFMDRADHLVSLGVNAVELMPIGEFAGAISWGYNPSAPYAVESDYGGVEGFKHFVKTCHEKGIAVILDVVYNHFGPSDLDLWQFDGWRENDKGGIYFYNDWRSSTPWGDSRPDYGRAEVREYIRNNALMWLDDYHVDGLRIDMSFYIRAVDEGADIPEGWSLIQWINDDIQKKHPGAIVIAEDLRSNEWLTKPTGEGGAGFGSQWDEQFIHPVRDLLIVQDDEERSLDVLIHALTFRYNDDAFQRVVYTESHDETANGKSRVPTEVDEYDQESYWARKRSALGACLVMTAPGIPMIFQGQEMLMTGHFRDDSELRWENAAEHAAVVRLYRDLIALRTNREGKGRALTSQDIEILHANHLEKILVFRRGNAELGYFLVVVNLSNRSWDDYRIPLPDGGRWRCLFQADSPVYDSDEQETAVEDPEPFEAEPCPWDGRDFSTVLAVGGYDCLILAPGDELFSG